MISSKGGPRAKTDRSFKSEVHRKLNSAEGQRLIKRAREQAGFPAEGLEPGDAFQVWSLWWLSFQYLFMATNPDPRVQEDFVSDLPKGRDKARRASATELRLLELGSLSRLLALRLAAAHIAAYLGIREVEPAFWHLLTPKGYLSVDWELFKAKKHSEAVERTWLCLTEALFAFDTLPEAHKKQALAGAVVTAAIRQKTPGASLDEVRGQLFRMFPFWQIGHWRNLRKRGKYWEERNPPVEPVLEPLIVQCMTLWAKGYDIGVLPFSK